MFRLAGLAISIGLADSMNPSTIAPALYLASGERPRSDLIQFTAAVFAVYFLGGLLLVAGPGQALLSLVPHPSHTTRYVLECIAGVVMLIAGVILWQRRQHFAQKQLPEPKAEGKSAAVLGVGIMVVELPTAFPYFAAIAAIVGSGLGLVHEVFLVALYNVCFVLPLLLILVTLTVAGDRAEAILTSSREFLQRRWPVILSVVALLAGAFVSLLGATGLASSGHGTAASISRRLHHVLRHPG
jgi:cytochrome c biogenesis protein CcdA